MANNTNNIKGGSGFDSLMIILYLILIVFGWLNIFAAEYDASTGKSMLDFSLVSTRQLLFIGTALIIILVIYTIDYSVFDTYSFLFYVGALFFLLLVLIFGKEIKGNRSWLAIGSFTLQPSEFAKFATGLALAKFLTISGNINKKRAFISDTAFGVPVFLFELLNPVLRSTLIIIGIPAVLILLQGDAGSAMVFSVFILVLYREGVLPAWVLTSLFVVISLFVLSLFIPADKILPYLIIPLLSVVLLILLLNPKKSYQSVLFTLIVATTLVIYIISAKYIFDNVLKKHQRERIMVLIDNDIDPAGQDIRYNLKHSKIAIGSGGFFGKGFMQGTQTKLKYVPEQSTDFIFCTVGEEYGWFGSFLLIGIYLLLLNRLLFLAERQKDKFARIYGYSVASILFFHFMINLSMTIGLFPVVGIPLPFLSYGGSSLWAFTILLFIFLKLDAHREQQMVRK
ncbi:MAG: rod shape-determining protein RodA [Bacteroidetes bacterium]|nr:MAG: rod shape-determining protein RodA [Bacteroidota bacterium]TAG86456.1 MAG: rod shape-determining protein RodA [Bacteroidota bacterium]